MARAVSSKSRYLPVPTRRRELVAPAGDHQRIVGIAAERGSVRRAAADEVDDLDLVAVADGRFAVAGAGDDLEVALDGNLARIEAHVGQQLVDGEPRRNQPLFAVDGDAHVAQVDVPSGIFSTRARFQAVLARAQDNPMPRLHKEDAMV